MGELSAQVPDREASGMTPEDTRALAEVAVWFCVLSDQPYSDLRRADRESLYENVPALIEHAVDVSLPESRAQIQTAIDTVIPQK
jgi:hypothetical protein